MLRKSTLVGISAAAALNFVAPAEAGSWHYVNGRWVWYSLLNDSTWSGITGKDLLDGTSIRAQAASQASDALCFNPQSKKVNPGTGPKVTVYGESPALTSGDALTKDNKQQGTTYQTTVEISNLVKETDRLTFNPCKSVPGSGSWVPTYWQDRNCNKGQITSFTAVCYKDYAYFSNGVLVYLSDGTPVSDTGTPSTDCPVDNPCYKYPSWTFVYLITAFAYEEWVHNAATNSDGGNAKGTCRFGANNETGATQPGQPYSIMNPPVNGWAAYPPVPYQCG